jgi:hypothetical protein
VPFVLIQVIMVALTIMFPQMVMHYKGTVVDPGEIEIIVPPFGGDQPGMPGGIAPPSFDLGAPPKL